MKGAVSYARAVIAVALLSGCSAAVDPAAITDAQTAARIKTALVNDPELGELAIEVRVVRGVAALSGRVGSQAQVERAIDLARAVPGVIGVQPNLQVGGDSPATGAQPARQGPQAGDAPEFDPPPGLLAVGASVGWSIPNPEALKTRVSISPLLKIGRPSGLGPAIGFDWFHADLESIGGSATLTRVHVKPVMAGIGYTVLADRFSLTPSIVGGFAFNSLTVKATGATQGLPVEVRNSVVWRVGVSAWYDASRRIAINVSTGYLMTGLRLTVLDGGRLEQRDASGDTTILHAGVAYRLF